MRTGVQEHAIVRIGLVEVFEDPVDLCTDGLGVVVPLDSGVEPSLLGDRGVVAPGGFGHVHHGLFLVWAEVLQKLEDDSEPSRAREALAVTDSVFLQHSCVLAEREFGTLVFEFGGAVDADVFVVLLLLEHTFGSLPNGWQDPGLAVLVAIGADAQVYLAGILVIFEQCVETEDGVCRG